ncbi:polyprenyl synthetase family protein [Chondromyces apiculatus]|uniref:Octaprenyl-diphosphate synthase n=1 Tax=Chondromyces apiculatus DSM 436 TaxID=1192034 RepID=A0A017TE80_9BACT|nr:polyprenyl synthetase family protein [Chondromyces apiculatus]EYF07578.1 Octaprenyl-diphosphate synthase [Chondromyces apiculatus DSM 436]
MVTKGVKADVKTDDVVATLGEVTAARGMDALTARLEALQSLLAGDLAEVEEALGVVGLEGDTPAHRSARHLLALGGKRLRPICVALAAHVGTGFNEAAKTFAVAVEMIHNATLLHDDVVDLGDRRRGADTARVVYGNAASIFGGDFLLADALCRVQAAGVDGVLPHMLKTVKELVTAETLQLAARGKVRSSTSDYFRIAQGKTASLFRWAMFAGARAGGVGLRECEALEAYGGMLGLAFQIVDDVLDYAGDPDATGKDLLTDLREGKMTYPLLLAVERDPGLAVALEANCRGDEVSVTPEIARRIGRVMSEGGVVPECLTLATRMCRDAAKSLEILPSSPARSALEDVALATPLRRK